MEVGWYDAQYIYLLSKVAYRDSEMAFPDSERRVKVKLNFHHFHDLCKKDDKSQLSVLTESS